MEYWQFLIQKAGDHSWLPLDSPGGEILEGRYQVVARSSHCSLEVTVQISYQFIEQGILKRRFQERSQVISADGLVIILPFTDLLPGLWDLTCCGHDASNPVDPVWHEFVQLQVLPITAEVGSDWDWSEPEVSPLAELQMGNAENDTVMPDETMTATGPEHILVPVAARRTPSLHLPTFNKQDRPLKFVVSAGQVFPPRLRATTKTRELKAPELPVLSQPDSNFIPHCPVHQEVASSAQDRRIRSNPPTPPADTTFESLNLRERFWSTLSALVQEPLRHSELDASSDNSARASQADAHSQYRRRDSSQSPDDRQVARGVGLPTQIQNRSKVNLPGLLLGPDHTLLKSANIIQSSPLDRSTELPSEFFDDEIVPTPRLIVPEGALTAGQPVSLSVRIPAHFSAVYVKLWVNDRQTYSLLDGPRWLVDFAQSQQGLLEVKTQLVIPLDSQEISFEAVAIEVQTQRESHKVTVERSVTPPGSYH